jgi:curved DNA-binding protein CbpA
MRTHYETLAVSQEASIERIRRAYRRLAKTCHPDLFPIGSRAQSEAGERIRDIIAAYRVLSNITKRAFYDATLRERACSYREAKPEHCQKCGNLTLYWRTKSDVGLCVGLCEGCRKAAT